MRSVRLDNTARLAAASGLLLLIIAQQKVCPWLLTPIEPVCTSTSDASDQSTPGAPERKRASPPYVVPDVSAPRWSGASQFASARQTVGAQDGVPRRGAQPPTTPPTVDESILDASLWPLVAFTCIGDGECVALNDPLLRLHPALRSTIRPTGPPC